MKANRKKCTAIAIQALVLTVIVCHATGTEIVYTDRHLVRYDNGMVYDTETGLEWYAGPDQGMSWQEASDWVAGLDALGGGWRMPTRRELKALHHIGDGVNNITYLLYNSGYWIWAGQSPDESARWIFSFSYGGEGWPGFPPADGGRVIAVRPRRVY
jgi:hypothetical protein